jgi:hypothetical protein
MTRDEELSRDEIFYLIGLLKEAREYYRLLVNHQNCSPRNREMLQPSRATCPQTRDALPRFPSWGLKCRKWYGRGAEPIEPPESKPESATWHECFRIT